MSEKLMLEKVLVVLKQKQKIFNDSKTQDSYQLKNAQKDLQKLENTLAGYAKNLKYLKNKSLVVNLNSFKNTKDLVRDLLVELDALKAFIVNAEVAIKARDNDLAELNAQIEATEKELSEYGQVIPFPKTDDRESVEVDQHG